MTKEENIKLIIDFFHRALMHHTIWFSEVQHQFGKERALQVLDKVMKKSYDIQMKRLSKSFGFEMQNDAPSVLLEMTDDALAELRNNVALNWLANDGVWFQELEFSNGMSDAKSCNDSSWAQFSPFEAWSIKRMLNLPDNAGLEGLKKAFAYRLYAFIGKQSITQETATSFVFQMNDCKVQSTRKRKGLDDYPCKSAGIIEFPLFASTIDARIKTECIGCPPDPHDDEWYCAWKFSMDYHR